MIKQTIVALILSVGASSVFAAGTVKVFSNGSSEAKTYSVATFYENFSFQPKGKYVIKVCNGTACHVRKSIPILERLYSELGISGEKNTTDDMLFTVETVSCLGACGLAPVLTVNDTVYPKMTPDAAAELIHELRGA